MHLGKTELLVRSRICVLIISSELMLKPGTHTTTLTELHKMVNPLNPTYWFSSLKFPISEDEICYEYVDWLCNNTGRGNNVILLKIYRYVRCV